VRSYVPFPLKIFLVFLTSGILGSSQQQQEERKPSAAPIAPAARLAAAKTALLRKTGSGSNIAHEVVSSTLEGWGRFALVNELDKADVIVEVYSVEESGGGVSAGPGHGGGGRSAGSQVIAAVIKLTVYDAKTRVPLWTATEHPKGAMKKVDRENNEVEAAEQLITKFHDDLEPPLK
jgi:hypothetical protein